MLAAAAMGRRRVCGGDARCHGSCAGVGWRSTGREGGWGSAAVYEVLAMQGYQLGRGFSSLDVRRPAHAVKALCWLTAEADRVGRTLGVRMLKTGDVHEPPHRCASFGYTRTCPLRGSRA
eukprot:2263079-Prymnesium_polylepis.1